MGILIGAAWLAMVAGLFVWGNVWTLRRARSMLNDWADENGYRPVEIEWRWLRHGPFWWRTSRGQVVFRIAVQDSEGRSLHGYARCGGFLFGVLAKRVTVIWDS